MSPVGARCQLGPVCHAYLRGIFLCRAREYFFYVQRLNPQCLRGGGHPIESARLRRRPSSLSSGGFHELTIATSYRNPGPISVTGRFFRSRRLAKLTFCRSASSFGPVRRQDSAQLRHEASICARPPDYAEEV